MQCKVFFVRISSRRLDNYLKIIFKMKLYCQKLVPIQLNLFPRHRIHTITHF